MTLLALDRVRRDCREGLRERPLLDDVTLELHPGELAVVWGRRRSGRSTLLRIAAGIEAPDAGTVRFEGHDLAAHGEDLLGGGIGYVHAAFPRAAGHSALEEVAICLLARGTPPALARSRARAALMRAGAEPCIGLAPSQLDGVERVRVALARALALRPRLLVIDEPTKGVDLHDRDPLLALLRSLADEGIAVLASAGESTALSGADRPFALDDGELRGVPAPEPAPVVSLQAARKAAGARARRGA